MSLQQIINRIGLSSSKTTSTTTTITRSLATLVEASGETYLDKLHNYRKTAIEQGKEHFRVGGRKIYFPSARIALIRPNAKHNPYQAKFIVPKSFNKLDLRDYLYHLYGLRAIKITTALGYAAYTHTMPAPLGGRHRSPQVKKMTITMLDPFVWPNDAESVERLDKMEATTRQEEDYHRQVDVSGSERLRPVKAYGGIIHPKPRATNFMSKKAKRILSNGKKTDLSYSKSIQNVDLIKKHLNL